MTEEDLEIIYILLNEAMPGYLKIGRTKDLVARVAALSNSTALPLPFTCAYAAKVADAAFVEQQLHIAFAPHRVSPKREFFRLPLESAIAAIRMVSFETVVSDVSLIAKVSRSSIRAYESVSEESAQQVISKEEALEDLRKILQNQGSIASQEELSRRWRRPKSTVSDWMCSWENIGAIPVRQTTGRCKLISAA